MLCRTLPCLVYAKCGGGWQEVDEYAYIIPPLGPHYSVEWAKQDRINYPGVDFDTDDNRMYAGPRTSLSSTGFSSPFLFSLLFPATEGDTITPTCGALVARVVAGLLEEGIIPAQLTSPIGLNATTTNEGVDETNVMMDRNSAIYMDPSTLEARIKRELIFIGLLDDERVLHF